jgi:hypothetical protein
VARRSSRCALSLAVLALIGSTGCKAPSFRGPQIQSPPSGFLLHNDQYQQRRMFPDREATMHSAWIRTVGDSHSGIFINGHAGVLTIEDAAAAQDEARRQAANAETTFGDIESMRIDGRTAWGWTEKVETPTLGFAWVAYAIEFHSSDPAFGRAAPDTLRTVISSFEIGNTEYNLPLIAMTIGAMLLGVIMMRARAQAQSERLRCIQLAHVPTPEERGQADHPSA